MSASNFFPAGNTVQLPAYATATSATVVASTVSNVNAWLVVNAGTNDVYFRLSPNPNQVASIPAPGAGTAGQMINAGDTYIIGTPVADDNQYNKNQPTMYFSALAFSAATTSSLFITPVVPISRAQ
jgi:hypothetical protein